jgi:hypothetical protein
VFYFWFEQQSVVFLFFAQQIVMQSRAIKKDLMQFGSDLRVKLNNRCSNLNNSPPQPTPGWLELVSDAFYLIGSAVFRCMEYH